VFTHTQTAGGASLDYALAQGERLDPVTFGMLSNNAIDGVCAVRRSQLDEQVVLHLDVAGLEDLRTWTSRHVRQEQVLQVLESLVTTLLSARSYMIDTASFVLDREHVFVDPAAPRAVLVCLPVLPQPQPDVLAFFKDLVINLDYDRTDGAAYMGSLIGYVMGQETLDLTQLSLELRSLQLQMATRSAPGVPQAGAAPAPFTPGPLAPAPAGTPAGPAAAMPGPTQEGTVSAYPPAAPPVAGLPPVPYPDLPGSRAGQPVAAQQSVVQHAAAPPVLDQSAAPGVAQPALQPFAAQAVPSQPVPAQAVPTSSAAEQPGSAQPASPYGAEAPAAPAPAARPVATSPSTGQTPAAPPVPVAQPVPVPSPRPSSAPAGFAVPGQPGQVQATAPRRASKRGGRGAGALPAPPAGRLTGPQPAAEEKLMSLAYLLQHYSAENKRVYDSQREARAARKAARAAAKQTAAPAPTGPAPAAPAGSSPVQAEPGQPWGVTPVAPFAGAPQDVAMDPRAAQHAAAGGAEVEGFGGTVVFGQGRHVASVAPQAPAAARPMVSAPARPAAALRRVATGEQVAITKDVFVIGRRSPRVDYALRHETVSKSHAIIYADADGYAIVDNSSTNGVLLDGTLLTPMTRQRLHHGARIHVGDELLEFLLGG